MIKVFHGSELVDGLNGGRESKFREWVSAHGVVFAFNKKNNHAIFGYNFLIIKSFIFIGYSISIGIGLDDLLRVSMVWD
jgi:hypothetical protein